LSPLDVDIKAAILDDEQQQIMRITIAHIIYFFCLSFIGAPETGLYILYPPKPDMEPYPDIFLLYK